MSLINTSLPNLIQGVSQQPDVLRYDGQCEEQENALSSVADGLKKRPNTRHVAKLLDAAITEDSFVHFVSQREDEKYVIIHNGTKLYAYNLLTGAEATINGATGGYAVSGLSYINTATPKDDLKALSITDTTLILNNTIEVQSDSSTTAALDKKAFVFIKQGDYRKNYEINLKSDVGGYNFSGLMRSGESSDARSADSTVITQDLYDGSAAAASPRTPLTSIAEFNNNFSHERKGNTIIFTENANDFTLDTNDGLGGEGIYGVYKKVDSITSLPERAPNGFVVEVAGDPEMEQDNYYVKFVTHSGNTFGEGAWEETVAPSVSVGLDNSTMPVSLVNTALNTFTIQTQNYSDRVAGDDDSNPMPSFVGEKISDIFLFKNRLGFLSRANVVLSEAGEFFNFFRTSVTTLLDSAPIDVASSSTRVVDLKAAIPFQEKLVMFSDNAQMSLSGSDILTPKTVSINQITSFDYASSVRPLPLGSYIYFPFTRGSYTGLREMVLSETTDTYNAFEVTEHVPSYIPKNIVGAAGTTSEDAIVLLSGDEPDALYVYNYFWNNNQKVLSAWSKFTFEGEIRGVEFIDSTLYIVLTHNNETQLLELPLESGLNDPVGYTTYLDQRIEATVLAGNDTITLPYTPAPEDTIEVYTKDGLKLSSSRTGSTVTLTQAVTEDTGVWLGYPYTMKYTFSELLFKASAGNSKSPSNAAKLKIRNGSLFYNDTAYFKVAVTPLYRDTYENSFTPNVVGSTTLGELNIDSGAYRFPVFSNAEDTKITITNDSALPSNFTSAEFESFVHSRSNRYAG